MGRRAKGEGAQMVDSSQKDQPESSNPSSERAKSSTKMIAELSNSASLRKKMADNTKAILRRSQRIQNTTLCTQGQDIKPVVENIDESENDEEDHRYSYEEKKTPETVLGAKSLEEKIDCVILILEAQEKSIEALKAKGADRCFPTQNMCFANIISEVKKNKYKNMYIDSQKKIESLRDGNCQLAKKLEHALGKLEAFENVQAVLSESIEKLKDAILISSLAKTTEAMLGLSSSRVIIGGSAVPTALAEAKTPAVKRRKSAEAKTPAAKRRKTGKD